MKTTVRFSTIAFAAILVFTLAGCKKGWVDVIRNPNTELKFCNIKKITNPYAPFKEAVFTYNELGNPTSIKLKALAYPFYTDKYTFRYDKKNRLKDFIITYVNDEGNDEAMDWHVYTYNNDGTVTDTNYWQGGTILANITNPVSLTGYAEVLNFDSKGRIIKMTPVWAAPCNLPGEGACLSEPVTVSYNSAGNINNGGTYDNKISLFRTNKIWMFLNRNYSLNNSYTATKYNGYDLPMDTGPYRFQSDGFSFIEQFATGRDAKIEYMCDMPETGSSK